jgi:thiamine biosynthesis lipoprotein
LDTSSTFDLNRDQRLWRIEFSAMASPCEVLCETDDFGFARALAQFAAAEARRIDEKFSRYKAGSVVAAILESRGRSIMVDDETARLLDYGEMLWRVSEGRFDLTSGILRHAWQFEEATHVPEPTRIPELMRYVGWQRLQWASPVLTLPAGMEIDFGGIGKEYAVDRVADFAARESAAPVLVNFGGDLRCTGAAPASGAWQVGIESLSKPGQPAKRIELTSGALATSGDARRAIVIDGQRYGHILNARTGWPAPGAPRSVTVAAPTCSQAGSYSTLAMLHGADAETFLCAEDLRYWVLH